MSNAVQAYFRGARAALRLHEYAAAVQLAQDGLKIDSSTAELKQMLQVQKIFWSWTACKCMDEGGIVGTWSILHDLFILWYKATRQVLLHNLDHVLASLCED